VEGADLVLAGLAAGAVPQAVFARGELAQQLTARLSGPAGGAGPAQRGLVVHPVSEPVAERIATLETPADLMAVFPLPERRAFAALRATVSTLVLFLDGVQDPGNVGTLLRAAVAFGATALATSPGCADLFGPKVVRAGMGAVFELPLLADVELADLVSRLGLERVYGLDAHAGAPLAEAGLKRPSVLCVGAERAGLAPATRAAVTELVTIPLTVTRAGAVESLNAGVAGAIALYEFARAGALRAPAHDAEDPRGAPAPQEG
jgi:TrmH family RNA methyltransferase